VHAESEKSPRDERRGERHLVSQSEDGKLGQKFIECKLCFNSHKYTTNVVRYRAFHVNINH